MFSWASSPNRDYAKTAAEGKEYLSSFFVSRGLTGLEKLQTSKKRSTDAGELFAAGHVKDALRSDGAFDEDFGRALVRHFADAAGAG